MGFFAAHRTSQFLRGFLVVIVYRVGHAQFVLTVVGTASVNIGPFISTLDHRLIKHLVFRFVTRWSRQPRSESEFGSVKDYSSVVAPVLVLDFLSSVSTNALITNKRYFVDPWAIERPMSLASTGRENYEISIFVKDILHPEFSKISSIPRNGISWTSYLFIVSLLFNNHDSKNFVLLLSERYRVMLLKNEISLK